MQFKNLDQNKAFIKNEAKRLGISPNAAYITYYSRNLLMRLSKINYGNLLVKGSFSQYIHLGHLSRPVLDLDLSSKDSHNKPLILLYQAIYEANDDVVSYDVSKLPYQTPNGVYKIPVVAKIQYPGDHNFINIPIGVDFKENNSVIFETQYKPVLPLFKGDEKFYINTPSFEEHLAEKLYIILHNRKLDIANTRVKDFYDIYKLHGKDYDADKFYLYFLTMLYMYGENIDKISSDFLNKQYVNRHLELWERMKKKYEFVDKDLELDEAVYYTKAVLNEQIQKIKCGEFVEQAKTLIKIR